MGRSEELAVLKSVLARAQEGLGTVILVSGEAGIGKSRLIAELAERAERDGVRVLIGECLPLDAAELPYAPLLSALSTLEEGGSPMAESVPLEVSQQAVFERLLAPLRDVARTSPLLLVIEDFQWADRSTRDFVSFFVRAARNEPIALVVSYRSDELERRDPLRPFLLELERSGRATRIELRRFDRDELRDQVAAILESSPAPGLVDALLGRSEGNPFFTEELLAWSQTATAPLPESFREVLLARVDGRAPEVREVLQMAAAAGRTVDHALLEAACALTEGSLDGALREASEAHLLIHDSSTDRYSFRHALVREAIYSDLLPGERRKRHLALARVLSSSDPAAARPAEPGELAHHWYAAGERAAALEASLCAAAAAERLHATGETWRHYERALALWDTASELVGRLPLERLEVVRRAGEAALKTGEAQRAVELAKDVTSEINESEDPVSAALAHERLGRYLWTAGLEREAVTEYRKAVGLMPEDPPSEERALVLAADGQALMLVDRTEESLARCQEALTIAELVGADAVRAHVLNTLCSNLSDRGQFDQAVAAAEAARGIAGRLGLVEQLIRSYINGSDALSQAGRLAESVALAEEGLSVAVRLGADGNWGNFLRADIAGRQVKLGQWAAAADLLTEAVDGRPAGTAAADTWMNLGHLMALRGDFDQARDALDQAERHVPNSSASQWLGPLTAARAECELWAGRPQSAAGYVADGVARLGEHEFISVTATLYEAGARACADIAVGALGDEAVIRHQEATARQLLDRLDHAVERLTAATPGRVAASRATASAETARIRSPGDDRPWAAAQSAWEISGDRYRAAYAQWRRAEALLRSGGQSPDPSALIREAHMTAAELGARPLRDTLERLAVSARIELDGEQPPSTAPGTPMHRLDLTPRELQVLTLLADGMTNREIGRQLFISDKTASVHVSRILAKLSVPNRTAAAAAAHQMGIKRDEGS